MENQIIIQLPTEVNELAQKVSVNKQAEVNTILTQIFTGTADWESQVDSIEVKGIDDKMSIELAEVARKNAKNARLAAEKIFDAKREEVQQAKFEYDLEDKLWLKAKQVMQLKFKAIEEKAEWKANFVKRYEAEQKELRTQNRILQVSKFAEINRVEFENMSDETFESFITGLEKSHNEKIEVARLAEEQRIEAERIEVERLEAQRIENIRLKAEVEAREKELAAERAKQLEQQRQQEELLKKAKEEAAQKLAAERAKAKAEILRQQKEQEATLKAEAEARQKVEAELRAKQEKEQAEAKAKQEVEAKAKKEAEKAAKAPIKVKLNKWVESFEAPAIDVENEKTKLINEKFLAFKRWAFSEVENL